MRYYILAFSALIIMSVTSCDVSNSSEDEFQGQRIGNWVQTSETSLKWIGSAGNVKMSTRYKAAAGDSTFYDAPNGNDLVLNATGNENSDKFSITYTDSSYSFAVFDTTEADPYINFIDPFDHEANNGAIGVSDDLMSTTLTVTSFSCDSTYNLAPSDDFAFEILADDGSVYETIVVDTDGVVEAMRSVGC